MMKKRSAIILALTVPFVAELATVVTLRRSVYEFGTGSTEIRQLFWPFFLAATGVPFLALGFKPLRATLIAIVYLPVMMLALVYVMWAILYVGLSIRGGI